MNELNSTDTMAFLKMLNKSENAIFQTFDDSSEKRQILTHTLKGSFEQHKRQLERLNRQGAGVFVLINESATTNAKKEDIYKAVAYFADSDDGDRAEIPLHPSMKVKTAHGFHFYWILEKPDSIDNFEKIQGDISNSLHTDPSIKNRNRLMRLPGFYHQKDPANPILIKIEYANDNRYTPNHVKTAFKSNIITFPLSLAMEGKWETGSRNDNLYKYVKNNELKLSPTTTYEQFYEFVKNANHSLCAEPLPEPEVQAMARSKYPEFQTRTKSLVSIAPTLTDLFKCKFPPKEPLVDRLIFKKQISIIGARPKNGKSTTIRYMTKCIADGENFLGRSTTTGSVLYLALEELSEDVRQDYIDMEVKNTDKIRITTMTDLNSAEEYNSCLEFLVKLHKPDLVVVDTMVHLLGVQDINDYAATTIALKKIRNFADTHNCHILLIHHSRKGEGSGNESLLGSTGIAGAVDLIMDIKKDDNNKRYFQTQGRSSQSHFDKTPLNFDFETKSFSVDVNFKSETLLFDSILAVIEQNELKSVKAIRDKVGGKTETISEALKMLTEQKRVNKDNGVYRLNVEQGEENGAA